jgi:HAD superfamily hydrolase (TIGR01662 family)
VSSPELERAAGGLGAGLVAVLFDYGLTLVHFERPIAAIERAQRAIVACIEEAGQRPPPVAVLTAAVYDRVEAEVAMHEASGALEEIDVGVLEARAFADLDLRLDAPTRDRCSALIQEAWWHGVRVYPDAIDVLRRLRRTGLRLGICSNAPYRSASMHGQLHHVGVRQLVDAAVFSADVGWRKPSPRLFAAALEAVGVPAERTLFVGDCVREDVEGAAAVGMRTVLVARGARARAQSDHQPDAVIRSLGDLPALLIDDSRL